MNCPNCNAEVKKEMVFCPECGKKLPEFQKMTALHTSMVAGESGNNAEKTERKIIHSSPEDLKKEQELKNGIRKLRCEISQLRIAVNQQGIVSRYRDPDYGQMQLPPQNLRKKEQEVKTTETNHQIQPYLIGCLVLYAAVIFSYFIGWVKIADFGNTTLSIMKIANLSESPLFLIFYVVPVLYLIGIVRLWMEQDFESTEWIHLPFVANVVIFVLTLIMIQGSKDSMDSLFEYSLATGPWLSLICGIAAEILVSRAPEGEETQEKIGLDFKKTKFTVPVVNYNGLLPFRPLQIIVNEDGELDIELKQYAEELNLAQMNITLVSQLHNVYRFWDVQIRNFRSQSNGIIRGTAEGIYEGPDDIVYAKVDVLQYSFGTGLARSAVPVNIDSQLPLERLEALRKRLKDTFHEPELQEVQENGTGNWVCVCGTENHADEETCILCRKKKQNVFQIKREV